MAKAEAAAVVGEVAVEAVRAADAAVAGWVGSGAEADLVAAAAAAAMAAEATGMATATVVAATGGPEVDRAKEGRASPLLQRQRRSLRHRRQRHASKRDIRDRAIAPCRRCPTG
jgi:hypothetical protein